MSNSTEEPDWPVPEPRGPQTVPNIACGNCDEEYHIDYCSTDERPYCEECGAFMRRPTAKEENQFTAFLVWNSYWMDVEAGEEGSR